MRKIKETDEKMKIQAQKSVPSDATKAPEPATATATAIPCMAVHQQSLLHSTITRARPGGKSVHSGNRWVLPGG